MYGRNTSAKIDLTDNLQPICVGVSVGQCEQFCILQLNPFFIGFCVGVGQCEHTIRHEHLFNHFIDSDRWLKNRI